MIVQCPSCAAKYRINDENIPNTGGKIRCPSCSHAFVVYPEHDSSDNTSVASQHQMNKLVSESQVLEAPEDEEDENAPTQMVASEEIDKIRAFQELEKQFGAAVDTDGTVEIENPMKLWMEAQRAAAGGESADHAATVELSKLPAPPASAIVEQSDVYEEAATEIVSSATLDLAAINPSLSPFGYEEDEEDIDPTEIVNVADVMEQIEEEQARTQDMSALPNIPPPSLIGGGDAMTQNVSPNDFPMSVTGSQPLGTDSGQFTSAPKISTGTPQTYGERPTNQWAAQADNPQLAAPALGADPNFNGPWSLKTNFGLTYEFPDTKSLNGWLQSRDDVQGYSLSTDATNFQPLAAFPQVMTRNAGASGSFNIHVPSTGSLADAINEAGREFEQQPGQSGQQQVFPGGGQQHFQPHLSAPGEGLSVEPSSGALVNNEYVLPSREGSPFVTFMWSICLASGLMTLLIAVQVFDVYDIVGNFKTHVLGISTPQEKVVPIVPEKTAQPEVKEEPVVDPEVEKARLDQIVKDAQRELDNNRPKSALEKLEKVVIVSPDRAEAYELMAQAHEKLGSEEDAEAARKKAEELTPDETP